MAQQKAIERQSFLKCFSSADLVSKMTLKPSEQQCSMYYILSSEVTLLSMSQHHNSYTFVCIKSERSCVYQTDELQLTHTPHRVSAVGDHRARECVSCLQAIESESHS